MPDTPEFQCKRSTFLALPLEIRNKIYHYLLHKKTPIAYRSVNKGASPSHDLAIFCTNHQTHIEASSIFYGRNKFVCFPSETTQQSPYAQWYKLSRIVDLELVAGLAAIDEGHASVLANSIRHVVRCGLSVQRLKLTLWCWKEDLALLRTDTEIGKALLESQLPKSFTICVGTTGRFLNSDIHAFHSLRLEMAPVEKWTRLLGPASTEHWQLTK